MQRRTISIPADLARKIEKIAKQEKRSFSDAVATLADEALRSRHRYVFKSHGAGRSGLPDLGLNHEKYMYEGFPVRDE